MNQPQLPHEILVHISTYVGSSLMMQQLVLYRPFYEYYTTHRQHIIKLHTRISVIIFGCCTIYTVFGKRHREDGPAITRADGTQWWYYNGKKHRVGGPAIMYANGRQYWYYNGKLHCVDSPAIIRADGTQEWHLNGKLHREDGPAVLYSDGSQYWYLNGELHRYDGPAAVLSNGSQY